MGGEHSRIKNKYQQTQRTQSGRSPDSYSGSQQQQTAASAPIYPNLNQGASGPDGLYEYRWQQPQHQGSAFVNADGHTGRPKTLMSEVEVKRLLDAQKQEYERKLEEVDERAKTLRTLQEAARAAQQRELQEAARAAAQREQQEAARAAQQWELQEAARAAAQREQQEAARAAQQRELLEVARAAAQREQQEAARAAAQWKQQEAARAAAQRKQQEEAAKATVQRKQQEEASAAAALLNSIHRKRDVLDCPTCYTRYGMRIFQCDDGHSSCYECKNRGRACGICRKSLTDRRNYNLENHVAQIKAPCPHTSEGCKLSIKIADMENHVRECPFKEQVCPIGAVVGRCRWKGKLSEISSHCDSMHSKGIQTIVEDATEMQLFNICNNIRRVHLIVKGVFNFLLHVNVSKTEGKVYMAVQLIGTKSGAMKWQYEIHVYNKSENCRKYMYTDNCCSSIDKIEDVFKAGECAVLPVGYAETFVCNGVLNYKFFIKRANEEKKRRRARKN